MRVDNVNFRLWPVTLSVLFAAMRVCLHISAGRLPQVLGEFRAILGTSFLKRTIRDYLCIRGTAIAECESDQCLFYVKRKGDQSYLDNHMWRRSGFTTHRTSVISKTYIFK